VSLNFKTLNLPLFKIRMAEKKKRTMDKKSVKIIISNFPGGNE